jgi:hypothetical protein
MRANTVLLALVLLLGTAFAEFPATDPHGVGQSTRPAPAQVRVDLSAVSDAVGAPHEVNPYETDFTYTVEWAFGTGAMYAVGVCCVQDTLIWVSAARAPTNKFYIYDARLHNGVAMDSFAQFNTNSWGTRDMAYDPVEDVVWGGTDQAKLDKIDATLHTQIANYTVTGSPSPTTVRAMAEGTDDSLYTGNFTSHPILKFSKTGTNAHAVGGVPPYAVYGLALDNTMSKMYATTADYSYKIIEYDYPAMTVADSVHVAEVEIFGGCDMWMNDTFLVVLAQTAVDSVFCFRLIEPGPDTMVALWLYSDYAQPDTTLGVRLAALGCSLVYMDVRNSTPAIGDLLPYGAIGVHSNYGYADKVALGNVLADYVDSTYGHGVVVGHFSYATGWEMGGRIMTGDYATIAPGSNEHSNTTLGWYNPAHPVMDGVSSVGEYFRGATNFISTDTVAKWADGNPYVAVSANQSVVGVNSYPGIVPSTGRTGDWALVFYNALRFAGGMVGTEEFDPLRPALHLRLETAPNPARDRVQIGYAVAGGRRIDIGFYDVNGRRVRSLFSGTCPSGIQTATWDMTDDQGRSVPAGRYFCRLVTGNETLTRMVVTE